MDLEELTQHLSSKKSKFLIFSLGLSVFGIALLGSSESFTHSKVSKNLINYTVTSGKSFNSIFNEFSLNPIEIVLLKIFLKRNSLNTVQAGHYDLKNKSWRDFLLSIANGDVVIFKLNIPAGKSLYEIKKIISDSRLNNDCDDFECLDDRFKFLEGTLKPDTYFYKDLSSAANILKKSQDEFFKLASTLWSNKNTVLPLKNLSEAIILASIVEKEAGNDSEKPIIAGVFLHRISIGMRLQADPTIIYGLLPDFNGNITKANLKDKNNPYNTYQISGLPPSPISTISKSSLEAVILGMRNDYLYFVAKGDGTHKFSKTYNEHLEAVKKYQLK